MDLLEDLPKALPKALPMDLHENLPMDLHGNRSMDLLKIGRWLNLEICLWISLEICLWTQNLRRSGHPDVNPVNCAGSRHNIKGHQDSIGAIMTGPRGENPKVLRSTCPSLLPQKVESRHLDNQKPQFVEDFVMPSWHRQA